MADSLFTKIIARQIPAKIVYEDDQYIVIHDINPQAPAHVLVIPKRPVATLNDLTPADAELVGGMFLIAGKVMKQLGYSDYRTVFNCGAGAQQALSPSLARTGGSGVHLAAGMTVARASCPCKIMK